MRASAQPAISKEHPMSTTESAASDPTPQRRWFRFSLRTWLIAMVLLGAGLGFLGRGLELKRLLPVWRDEKGWILLSRKATRPMLSPGVNPSKTRHVRS
jgi:hypothetical protein